MALQVKGLLCTFQTNSAGVQFSHPQQDTVGLCWSVGAEEAANISLASRRQECLGDCSRPTKVTQGTFGFSSRTAEC